MIELSNVSKFYYSKGVIATGFSKVNVKFEMGEFVAITGESGSGKSTLLNVISGLDSYEEGEMFIEGNETSHFTEKDFENYRRKYIGNIFQNFNLVNSYTVYQNIELVMLLAGFKGQEVKKKVNELIEKVGLTEYKNTKASKLSGGQKQRVAIARALAKDTPIIIADEPTGNLDSESAAEIIKLLSEIAEDKLVIIVTHNYDQVEPYVTRKIKMHDGKVIEDSYLKEHKEVEEAKVQEIENIRPLPLVKLGVRNSFNIPVKFLLLVFVFFFIATAITTELSSFKNSVYEGAISGYNFFFNNLSDKRAVLKKSDNSSFSENDLEKIKALDNVDYIVTNDFSLDEPISIQNEKTDFYFYGFVKDISTCGFDKVDLGRMPEKPNEIVLGAQKDSYDLGNNHEAILGKTYNYSSRNGEDKSYTVVVVGIKYLDDMELEENTYAYVYIQPEFSERIKSQLFTAISDVSVLFENKLFSSDPNSYGNLNIVPSPNVPEGEAYCSENFNYFVKNNKAVGKELKIDVSNIYFEDSLTVKISKTFNKKNFASLTGERKEDFEYSTDTIFVNPNDYSKLFYKDTFQISVFVKDPHLIKETQKTLTDMGYKTLIITDTTVNDGSNVIMKIISFVVTLGLSIALFLISYFVIRIILRSRNSYYSTVRMLGANVGTARNLLIIELLTDANIACALTALTFYLLSYFMPKNTIVISVMTYMGIADYLAIYSIVLVISLLISIRYSSRLFKKSAINTIKEEV
ncbi:MAG: ABC transporter ATP-binding protein [Oscillospiraceae bacterium]|nr:ABC transporter ATP-binding protein [Oscillospiraceae bacterium]